MTDERAHQIIQSAKTHVEELRENGALGEEVDPLETTDLIGLGIDKSLVQRLLVNGFTGIQGLVERDEELSQISGFTYEEIETVRVAAEEFLRRSPLR